MPSRYAVKIGPGDWSSFLSSARFCWWFLGSNTLLLASMSLTCEPRETEVLSKGLF